MSLNTSPLSGSKGAASGSGLPKLTKLGTGLSKNNSGLPKLGSSGLSPLNKPLKKKDAPSDDAAKDAQQQAESRQEEAPSANIATEALNTTENDPAAVQPAESEDLAGSSISMLMPDMVAFLSASEDEDNEKTGVQSTDEFLGHLLAASTDNSDDAPFQFDLNNTNIPPAVPPAGNLPKPPVSDSPKMPDVPSVDIDTSATGVSSINLTTPSVEMPAATQKIDPSVTIMPPDAPALSPQTPDVMTQMPMPPVAQDNQNACPPVPPPPAPRLTPEEEMLALMTPEERQAYEQEKMFEQMTPEERQAYEEQRMLENMTPEEREAYAFENMTPEEQEAYQAHMAQVQADEEARKQQRRQEMYNNYILDQQNAPKKSSIMPIVIIAVIVLALIAGGFVYMKGKADEEAARIAQEEAERAAAEAAAAVPQKTVSDYELTWYDVTIDCPAGAALYVNGVEIKSGDATKFVKDHTNTVVAYLDGMVPYFRSFQKDAEIPETITVEFEPDKLYMKTNVELKLKDASIKGHDLKITFDGRSLPTLPDELHDVVMGRPHILVLQKPGFAPHFQMFWPTKVKGSTKARVHIPQLELENNAQSGAILNTKDFPKSAEPYGIRIRMGETIWQSPTLINAPHGAFVEYAITRKQRQPLHLGIYPDIYGSVQLDTDLLQDSLGNALVSFKVPKGAKKDALDNLQICFRREGVSICPDMKAETEIPSGPDWKVIAYTKDDMDILRNEYGQDLKSKRGYIFSPKVSQGSLVLDPPEWRVLDDASNKKKK